ncbi:MAG TPA: type 1 glutamine amidotransferase, partial [Tianweitania sediminis]|nr:type 1 glutamine amidotransferase [Tianweitania sediminis]
MKLTILQTGEVPETLRGRFGPYPGMFERMFDQTGRSFAYEAVKVSEGEPLPDAGALEGVVLTGSSAGVYDDFPWMEPLREFIRDA